MSAKYEYTITGITNKGVPIIANCVSKDIFEVLYTFKENGIYIHTIPSRKQVHADAEMGIKSVSLDIQRVGSDGQYFDRIIE